MQPIVAFIRRRPALVTAALFWLVAAGAALVYWRTSGLSALDVARQLANVLTGTWYGPLLYVAVYFVRPLILFPASVLTILAGSVYGPVWGGALGLFAGTASATLPYLFGRWFARRDDDTLEDPRLTRFIGPLREDPFVTVLIIRLLFLPYDAANVFLGGLGVRAWVFFGATLLGNVVGSLPYILAGASLSLDEAAGGVRLNPWVLVLALLVMVVSIVVSRVVRRRQAS